MKYMEVAGCRMAYHRQGAGDTILLVHGITTYAFIWREIVSVLSNHYDVISVDLIGCGDSDKPLNISYAIKDHAEYLKLFTDQLGIDRFHFVGHDLGGGIGQIFAVSYPEMLRSLTLINSVAYDFWPVQPITAMRTPIVRQLMMSTFDLGAFRLIVQHGIYHKGRVTDELMALFNAPMQISEGRKAFLHFARCLDNHNLTDIEQQLRQLDMPVLIVRGDADSFLSPAIAEKLHSEITDSRLERIATAGHFIQIDEPEWLSQQILSFVRQVSIEHGFETEHGVNAGLEVGTGVA